MVYPLKLMVPLVVRLLMVQSPVRFQVLPASIVRTALSETAVPFCALSTMLMVPIKVLFPFRVIVRVEIVSTTMLPLRSCWSAVNITCAPFAPAVPQPWEAELLFIYCCFYCCFYFFSFVICLF